RNRYAYVSGNPINRVDPSGLFDWSTRTVENGDYLYCIAREGTDGWNGTEPPSFYSVTNTYYDILDNNRILNPNVIHEGLQLNIPEHIRRIGLRNANKSCHPERVVNLNVPGIP